MVPSSQLNPTGFSLKMVPMVTLFPQRLKATVSFSSVLCGAGFFKMMFLRMGSRDNLNV